MGNTTFPDWVKNLLHFRIIIPGQIDVTELPQCSEAYIMWPSMIQNIPETASSDQSLDIK